MLLWNWKRWVRRCLFLQKKKTESLCYLESVYKLKYSFDKIDEFTKYMEIFKIMFFIVSRMQNLDPWINWEVWWWFPPFQVYILIPCMFLEFYTHINIFKKKSVKTNKTRHLFLLYCKYDTYFFQQSCMWLALLSQYFVTVVSQQ